MAVSDNDLVVGPLVPAAGVTTISLDFYFEKASWLEVYKTGSETPLILNTDYTVSDEGTTNGVVTLTTPANGTDAYSVYLAVPLERSSDLQLRGEFKSEPFNIEIDRLWQALQGVRTMLGRSVSIPRSALFASPKIASDPSTGATLVWSQDGDLVNGPAEADLITLAQASTAAASQAAAAAAQVEASLLVRFPLNAGPDAAPTNYAAAPADTPWLGGALVGPVDASGRKMPNYYQRITDPLPTGSNSNFINTFDQDRWATPFRYGVFLDGSDVAGQPTTAYTGCDAAAVMHLAMISTAGYDHDQQSGTQDQYEGRTNIPILRIHGQQKGGGDMPAIRVQMQGGRDLTRPDPLATDSTPAAAILQGSLDAIADKTHILFGEIHINDNGYNTRGEGPSIILWRDRADDQGMQAWWEGHRISSRGSVAVDMAINIVSPNTLPGYDYGINMSGAAFTTERAMVLGADQKIEFFGETAINPTTGNKQSVSAAHGWVIGYEAGGAAVRFKAEGVRMLEYSSEFVRIGKAADDVDKVRIPGDLDTRGLQFGSIGATTYISAPGTDTDVTQINLRTRNGSGSPANALIVKGDGDVNIAKAGAALQIESQDVLRKRGTALPADATDLATAMTLVNTLKARLSNSSGSVEHPLFA